MHGKRRLTYRDSLHPDLHACRNGDDALRQPVCKHLIQAIRLVMLHPVYGTDSRFPPSLKGMV